MSTAKRASASPSHPPLCTHPKWGWTPDAASCLPPHDVQKKSSSRVTFACPLRGHVELVLPSAGEGMVKKCRPAESARWIRSYCEEVTSTPLRLKRNVSRPTSSMPVLKPATLCLLPPSPACAGQQRDQVQQQVGSAPGNCLPSPSSNPEVMRGGLVPGPARLSSDLSHASEPF